MIPGKERFFELVMAVSTANAVMRVELSRGRRCEQTEKDYQEAVRELDNALDLIYSRLQPDN